MLLNPLDSTIKLASYTVTDRVVFPLFKLSYQSLGWTVSQTMNLFSSKLGNWVKKGWNDPLSTKHLIQIGEWTEWLAKGPATSKPLELPILGTLDRCRISFCRHIYVVSKDFTSILKIPDSLRGYADWKTYLQPPEEAISSDQQNAKGIVNHFVSKGWSLIGKGTSLVAQTLLSLIAKVIEASAVPLHLVPYVNMALEAVACKVDDLRNHIHASITKKANQVIKGKERDIRKQAIGMVAEVGARSLLNQVLNVGAKLTVGYYLYDVAKQGFAQAIGNQQLSNSVITALEITAKVAGLALVSHVMLPTIERIHDDYKSDFNAEAQTLTELQGLIKVHNLPKIIKWFQRA